MWKTEAADDSVTVQFLDININITVELPAYLYATLCSRIAVKVNKYLIQTFLNTESEINMINYKIIEVCDISICCEVTLKMRTADSEKVSFYDWECRNECDWCNLYPLYLCSEGSWE